MGSGGREKPFFVTKIINVHCRNSNKSEEANKRKHCSLSFHQDEVTTVNTALKTGFFSPSMRMFSMFHFIPSTIIDIY